MQSQGAQPCIITAAITGSLPRKEHNPAVPITVSEQVEATQLLRFMLFNRLRRHEAWYRAYPTAEPT